MVQQKLSTPDELFHFQLRSATTMEKHSLEALGELRVRTTLRKAPV